MYTLVGFRRADTGGAFFLLQGGFGGFWGKTGDMITEKVITISVLNFFSFMKTLKNPKPPSWKIKDLKKYSYLNRPSAKPMFSLHPDTI